MSRVLVYHDLCECKCRLKRNACNVKVKMES